MLDMQKRFGRWMPSAVLILLLLAVATLPLVVQFTYAGRSEAPDHVLTYTTGKLRWDKDTGIDKNGAAVLSLFQSRYDDTVLSDNGARVVAPGTEGFNLIRLHNKGGGPIQYTAVLYQIRQEPALPVQAALEGSGFTDAKTFPLPDGVSRSQVLRAVSGKLKAKEIQNFDIRWLWEYAVSDSQDQLDTLLGGRAADGRPDDVTIGLYIVVQDNNETVIPQTGDNGVGGYLLAMAVSGTLLLLLVLAERRKRKC